MTRSSLVSLALFSVCAVAAGCSDSHDSNEPQARRALPVVGGEPAGVDDYPSTVALTDPYGSPFCTGTLVSPTIVVTAAHCLQSWWGDPISTDEVRIVYGYTEPDTAPSSDRRTVSSVTPNPNYDPWANVDSDGMGHTNDIGVVVLDEPVENGVITPILPSAQLDPTLVDGTDIHVVGYGVYNMNTQAGGILYKALTPYMRRVQWEMLAGSPGNPDSCNGDSGGPAYVVAGGNLYLAGITSRAWAQSQQSCGDGGIYTLASEYVDWIESVGGELDGGVLEGGWDSGADVVLLDADPTCLPPTGACHPVTNEGCDTSQGEVCQLRGTELSCHEAPNEALPGEPCDEVDQFCTQGYHCAASSRCERLCCSDADCPSGGPCTAISAEVGTLGTCGLDPVDAGQDAEVDGAGGAAGAGGEGGAAGDAGLDAGPSTDVAGDDDGGCGCRTAGTSRSGTGAAWLFALGAVWAARRRRAKQVLG